MNNPFPGYNVWRLLGAVMIGLFVFLVIASGQPVSEAPAAAPVDATANLEVPANLREMQMHRVTEGETLAALAARFNVAPEDILRNNNLANPGDIKPGQPLVIPGERLGVARQFLAAAQQNLNMAIKAGAATFAPVAFDELKKTVAAATRSFDAGNYEKTIAFSAMTGSMLTNVLATVQKNALQPLTGKLVQKEGTISMSVDNQKTWTLLNPGDAVPEGALLSTKPLSTAIVEFPGASIDLIGGTTLQVDTLSEDKRSGDVDVEISVLVGEVLGEIKPLKKSKKPVKIQLDRAAVAIRGSTVRAGFSEDQTARVVNVAGMMDVSLGGQSLNLKPGDGVFAPPGQGLSAPAKMLNAPTMVFPKGLNVETPDHTPDFMWQANARPGASYLIETAKDPDFRIIVDRRKTDAVTMPIGPLSEGDYHWRVFTLDENGLQSVDVQTGTLQVSNNLKINLTSKQQPIAIDGKNYIGPSITYGAKPVSIPTSVVDFEFDVNGVIVDSPGNQVTFDKDGEYILIVRGVSETGAKGDAQSVRINVDAKGPEIRMHLAEPQIYATAPEKGVCRALSILVSDISGVKGLLVTVDGELYETLDAPILLPVTRAHNVAIQSQDRWGNTSTRNLQVPIGVGADEAEVKPPVEEKPYFDFLFPK